MSQRPQTAGRARDASISVLPAKFSANVQPPSTPRRSSGIGTRTDTSPRTKSAVLKSMHSGRVLSPDCSTEQAQNLKRDALFENGEGRAGHSIHCCRAAGEHRQEIVVLKQQLRRAREQVLGSTRAIERLRQEGQCWRDRVVSLSQAEKQHSVEVHLLGTKIAQRDDWLRESLPHKQMLQEQTAQMRADYENEIKSLQDELATARADASAERERLEGKLAAQKEDREREERVLREALRVLERDCAALRVQLGETTAAALLVPGLQCKMEQAQQENAALKVVEQQHGSMSVELEQLRQRLPQAEAEACKATRERDVALEERRKSDEAQQSLVKSLEQTQLQHEQLEASLRREKKDADCRHAHERSQLQSQIADLRAELEAEQKATARKQQLLEETRRRAEDDAKASEREMADVRAAFAEEKRAREVEHLKVCQRLEGSVTELEGKAKGLEAKLRESERREEDLRRDLEIALQRAAQAEQTAGQLRSELKQRKSEVEQLTQQSLEANGSIQRAESKMDSFVQATSKYLDKISIEFRRLTAGFKIVERERDSLFAKVKKLTDEDALAKIVRRNKELEWLLEQTMARNEAIDGERRVFIRGLEAALARSGHQMRELMMQVASWKGAHASSVQMLQESCSAFAAYSDKLGQEKDSVEVQAQQRLRHMQAVQAELEVKLQVMAQTSQRAESSLELAQAEQHNAERLMEGSVKMLRERCAGLEKELRRVQTENSRWEQRVAVAERKVREGELLHARDSTLYTHQVGDLEAKIRHLSSTVSAVADPRCCAGLL